MTVALHHGESAPAAERLDAPQVHPRHDEPRGERVAIAVPGIALGPGHTFPAFARARAALVKAGKELVRLLVPKAGMSPNTAVSRPQPLGQTHTPSARKRSSNTMRAFSWLRSSATAPIPVSDVARLGVAIHGDVEGARVVVAVVRGRRAGEGLAAGTASYESQQNHGRHGLQRGVCPHP